MKNQAANLLVIDFGRQNRRWFLAPLWQKTGQISHQKQSINLWQVNLPYTRAKWQKLSPSAQTKILKNIYYKARVKSITMVALAPELALICQPGLPYCTGTNLQLRIVAAQVKSQIQAAGWPGLNSVGILDAESEAMAALTAYLACRSRFLKVAGPAGQDLANQIYLKTGLVLEVCQAEKIFQECPIIICQTEPADNNRQNIFWLNRAILMQMPELTTAENQGFWPLWAAEAIIWLINGVAEQIAVNQQNIQKIGYFAAMLAKQKNVLDKKLQSAYNPF